MGKKNKIAAGEMYFVTMTVVDWIDIFTRPNQKLSMLESLRYCQRHKDLQIYAWCLMPSHLHMIASTLDGSRYTLSDVLRDLKKYTSKQIIENIQEEPESRREWLLDKFAFAGRKDPKIKYYKVWQEGNEAKEIHTNVFLEQKINYIHENPVTDMTVAEAHAYLFSSAADYTGGKGLLEVIIAD